MRDDRSWLIAATAGLVFAASAGCSNGPSLSDLPAQQAQVYCQKAFSCCSVAEANDGGLGTSQSTCVSTMINGLSSAQAQAGVSKGRLAYHSDVAQECLDVYGGLSCSELKSSTTSGVPACNSILEPKVAIGGACDQDGECVGGTCPGGTSTQDAVCVALAGEGSSCNPNACGEGLICNAVLGAPSPTCIPISVDGAPCTFNEECVSGGCNGEGTQPDGGGGTCGLKGGSGTTCYLTTGCSSTGLSDLALLAFVASAAWYSARRRAHGPRPRGGCEG